MFDFLERMTTDVGAMFSSGPPAPAAHIDALAPAHAKAPEPAPAVNANGEPAADGNAAKPVDRKAMDAAANTIFKSMDGWWVSGGDKTTVLDTLRGKSPAEITAIKASYAEHFPGHSLDSDLSSNLDGKDLQEAKAELTADPVQAAVAALRNAESGTFFGNCDGDKVTKILEGITDPAVRKRVRDQVGGELTEVQDGNDKELTQALLDGNTAKASAVKLDEAMNGGLFGGGGFLGTGLGEDKTKMYDAISACKDEKERLAMMAEYKQKTGEDLQTTLDESLSGADKDVATNLIAGDKAGADAARVKAATEGFFTDKDAIYKRLDGKSETERAALIKKFNEQYGGDGQGFDATLQDNLGGMDLEKAQMLEKQGKLDDTFALNYAMNGSFFSTDKEAIKATLEGKSAEEIAKLQDKYLHQYGIDLKQELSDETSGRDGFEIKELMKGEPVTLEDKVARARERYQFERGSGSNAISTGIMDTFSDKGEMLDDQEARVEALFKKYEDGSATAEDKAVLERVTGYQQLDTKNYQESKDNVTNTIATVAAVTAGAIVTIASAGAAAGPLLAAAASATGVSAPALVAAGAAAASGIATIGTKMAIQDGGYSNEELRNDLIMAGVNGVSGGAIGAMGAEGGAIFNMAGKMAEGPVAQAVIIQGLSGASSSSITATMGAMLAGKSLPEVLEAGGIGALTGGVGGAVTGGLGEHLKEVPNGWDEVNWSTTRGAIAGATGAAAGNVFNPDAYKGDSGSMLNNWLTTVGGGAVTGAATGFSEGKEAEKHLQELAVAEREAREQTGKPVTEAEQKAITDLEEWATTPAEKAAIEEMKKQLQAGGAMPAVPELVTGIDGMMPVDVTNIERQAANEIETGPDNHQEAKPVEPAAKAEVDPKKAGDIKALQQLAAESKIANGGAFTTGELKALASMAMELGVPLVDVLRPPGTNLAMPEIVDLK